MFLDCILNFLHSASATFKMGKFHVVSGSDNGSFQGALQYDYSDLKGGNKEDSIYA